MIGIVTPYKVVNYGTKLQAYAMQELLSKYDDAELLGFVPGTDRRLSSIIGKVYLKLTRKKSGSSTSSIDQVLKKREKAINSFDRFYKFGKTVKGNTALKNTINNYSTIVCGSDQLWAPSNVIADYFTLTLIPENINKFSYAASFGINDIPKRLRKRYKKFITRLNFVSVREQQGKVIVKEVAGKDATVVLDPTLMIEATEWGTLAEKSKIHIEKQYVFCYFLGISSEHREFARKLAEKKGLVLVSIPYFKGWNEADKDFGDIQIYEAGPVEFLNLIKCACYVCTDSFHGAAFSILFKRQVAVFERFKKTSDESTNSRIYTLLESFGMKKQLYTNDKDVDAFLETPINYADVDDKLSVLREESFSFLDNAIGKKRK